MDLVTATIGWLTSPDSWQGPGGIPARLVEHVEISGLSLLLAALIALPLGLAIGHTGRGAWLALNSANAWRAFPSLAAIGMLVPFTASFDPNLGFTFYPTVIAMVVLAVPPILVNAYAGVSAVDRELVDAARGMGMTGREILGRVEIPNALPVIMTGIRSAAVQVVATATLGAVFGFGGLGRFLIDGDANQDNGEMVGGVLLVALLAIVVQGLVVLAERRLVSPGLARSAATETPVDPARAAA